MNFYDIKPGYHEWLTKMFVDLLSGYGRYRKLAKFLYLINFHSYCGNDINRIMDGLSMRRRFAHESGYDIINTIEYDDEINDIEPECSVLEMMVALATRCEERIMGDGDTETDIGRWLYTMLVSMHIDSMEDSFFDPDYVSNRIDILINRDYHKNGDGGLFTISDPTKDMRDEEIWYQMCWYLSEIAD